LKITLKIFEREKTLFSKVLDEGVYRIGRSEFCDVVLGDESVSRTHLELRVSSSNVYMTNVSSSGRVRVNSTPLETAELGDGDTLEVGHYRIIVYFGERESSKGSSGSNSQAKPEPPSQEENQDGQELASFKENVIEEPEKPVGGDELEVEELPQLPSYRANRDDDDGPLLSEGTAALNRAETQVEIKPVVAKLLFTEGPRKGEELMLETYEVTFGRSKRADIFLDDEKLSRTHAKIARVGMGYRLIDLNSRNGTFVNGMRVLEHPLSSFDVIEMGSTKISFLIHDLLANEVARGALVAGSRSGAAQNLEQTRSLQIDPDEEGNVVPLHRSNNLAPVRDDLNLPPEPAFGNIFSQVSKQKFSPKTIRIALLVILLLGGLYFLLPSKQPTENGASGGPGVGMDMRTQTPLSGQGAAPPSLTTKEYLELTPDMQRAIEGHYTSALRAADQDNYEEAIANLKKIHEVLPYYKQSKELLDQYSKRLREKQIQEAAEKAKKDETQELALYLEDGKEYLKQGDFERAAEAFNSAITLDPNNMMAVKGLKAAEFKIRRLEDVPPDRDPEKEKQEQVQKLFEKAVEAFSRKSYQEAIENAEEIRKIELKGETQYLNEAKQIIDKSRQNQKEEFEPFLTEAKEKYAEGDYNAARDLCEEMLKRNPAYDDAKDLLLKTKKQLGRLAKEAYVRGYILESMSRIDEAKQYWNRAKNYTRPGDDYYDKVNKKLDQYQ
jgi:pSer/pThr/pTyr-binding forkhead associated (FHA) protein/tetratricopeptide (TPR) repeat protein